MHLIKVNAIDSTNSLAREMFREKSPVRAFGIFARQQLQGRGQRGTSWDSKPGQNLTFSMLYPKPQVLPGQQFLISASVATAIVKVLKRFNIPNLSVKWPNDIMSARTKIGGILIENIVSENSISATIVGVGLNVNQTEFEGLPVASSLKLATGIHFDLEEVLDEMLAVLERSLDKISSSKTAIIMEEYKRHLFRKNIPSTFQLEDKSLFTGMIEDVSLLGKLVVRTEADEVREFDLKEVRLCF